MSTYVPTDWVDGVTPTNAANLDHIEQGIVDAHAAVAALDTRLDAEEAQPDIPPVQDGKWLSGQGGALVWADPPAGGGGAIEYENVWAAATPYTAGDVVKHNGVEYLAVNPSTGQTPPAYQAPSAVLPIPIVTALPASPFDGQEVILIDATPNFFWRLRYVPWMPSNKWVFVGGSPLEAEVNAAEATAAGAYANLGTVGPQVVIPVAGVYIVEHGAAVSPTNNTGYGSYAIGATAADDADRWAAAHQSGYADHGMRIQKKTLPAATLTQQYKTPGGSVTFSNRYFRVTPVAVGG